MLSVFSVVNALPAPRLTLPRTRLLRHDLEFQAVYDARMKKAVGGGGGRGGLAVFTVPNGKAFHRLGLAVAKRGGTGVDRNRVKRLIREAFRLEQGQFTTENTESTEGKQGEEGATTRWYDIIVAASADAAETLTLEQARAMLRDLVAQSDRAWRKRRKGPA